MRRQAILVASALALAMATPAAAKTFKWANDGDTSSLDPYVLNETFLLSFTGNIYEPLVRRAGDLKLEAALATEWTNPSPTLWRFKLRQGVKFHNGNAFTADDVVFSYNRARADGSNIKSYFSSVKEIRKVDDFTVEMETSVPNPILVDELANWFIMDKEWAEANNTVKPGDITKKEESFATRNANGTGPFVLKSREAEVKTTLAPYPGWWDKPKHNLTDVQFSVVKNPATRVSALLSGELDMIYNVPPQDQDRIAKTKGLKVLITPETRIVYFGFDQLRDELQDSSVKGKNPFKDIQVREAFMRAIDVNALKAKVMRGESAPTALMVATMIKGYDKALDQRPAYDPKKAKELLAAAGYPNGFEVGLDCPNDRYVNDEKICVAAATMLSQIGIKVNLKAQTKSLFFQKILAPRFETSFFMLGWTPATYDSHNMIQNLAYCRKEGQTKGLFNVGGYCNPKVDELSDKMLVETDQAKRTAMMREALKTIRDDIAYIPLHQQTVVWASKASIGIVQRADNAFPLMYVNVK
jgi:peptide/nickel transport system substrate-binding protein